MTTNLVAVEYIGTKPVKKDNVAETGLSWTPGQVHYLPVIIATKLFAHPSIWIDGTDTAEQDPSRVGMVVDSTPDKPNTSVEDDTTAIDLPNLQNMTKPDIQAYALRAFNVTLEPAMKKDDMIQQVVSLRNAEDSLGANK